MSTSLSLTLPSKLTSNSRFLSALQILGASFFIALCAKIYIPLFFTPVPLSGATFAVMLMGATLGSRKGMMSVVLYFLEGALGLPVFGGISSGFAPFIGATGGYLIGYALQAYLVGWCFERKLATSSVSVMGTLLLSVVMQLGLGALWLSNFVGIGNALAFGVAPFIIGEIIKAFCVTAVLLVKRHRSNS